MRGPEQNNLNGTARSFKLPFIVYASLFLYFTLFHYLLDAAKVYTVKLQLEQTRLLLSNPVQFNKTLFNITGSPLSEPAPVVANTINYKGQL